jgi:hypothetical protein
VLKGVKFITFQAGNKLKMWKGGDTLEAMKIIILQARFE